MHSTNAFSGFTRRDLLSLIGATAGGAVMYQAMTSLGYAAGSDFTGPIKLEGDPKGATVLILGAGLAGMAAALEMRKVSYKFKILEYDERAGGRNWTVHSGDKFTELGGEIQTCEFDKGQYINLGPWRIPYHHLALLYYCKQIGVTLELFQQFNYNAYLHSTKAYGGKPQRILHSRMAGGRDPLIAECNHQTSRTGHQGLMPAACFQHMPDKRNLNMIKLTLRPLGLLLATGAALFAYAPLSHADSAGSTFSQSETFSEKNW